MKNLISNFLLPFLFLIIFYQNVCGQNWFPLEIGNRWDYRIGVDFPGGFTYDTISIEIVDQKTLTNGLEYFEFSVPYPLWDSQPFPMFIREENNNIYFFDVNDSSDCFAFRFDLPIDSDYVNCHNDTSVTFFIHEIVLFGTNDSIQDQAVSWPYIYRFSKSFGITSYSNVAWLTRYYFDLEGCIISDNTYGNLLVSVENESTFNSLTFSLAQNYPNPFNPVTSIQFAISNSQFVSIKVYDVLGKEIATLVNEQKPAGEYNVEFNGTGLPSGIYFYQLRAGNFVETKKMVLLR